MTLSLDPTPDAARERLALLDPTAYARSRNALDGAVSGLSPWITHGFLSLPEVAASVQPPLAMNHKFIFELAWREYFQHVWAHEGERIFHSLHPGPLPDQAYARELPADIRQARTGIPAIDASVRQLYATGWLHNHARMWLASYVVHLRRVHWRAGAHWMVGHLLDGDLASNHLSWQWVAGTASHKPYLFNADNVARFAGRHLAEFDSRGSAVDASYEALERIARGAAPPLAAPSSAAAGPRTNSAGVDMAGVDEPPLLAEPPPDLLAGVRSAHADELAGQDVWLVHPWALATPPAGHLALLYWQPAFHRHWPWSERRWRFVFTRMAQIAPLSWPGDQPGTLAAARSVSGLANAHLAAHDSLVPATGLTPVPRLFPAPPRRCASFSDFWRQVSGA